MIRGFFSLGVKTKSTKILDSGKTASCASCGLYQFVLSPKMEAYGNFNRKILNIGEAPGDEEDRKGRQWQGKAGKRLQQEYKRLGVDLFDDCLNINAVNCRPTEKSGANRTPTAHEMQCCRPRVFSVIKEYKPNVIILLGTKAIESVLGNIWTKDLGGIGKWRGLIIPDQSVNAWICPVWHPSFMERQQGFIEMDTIWKHDLKNALAMVDVPLPEFYDTTKQIGILNTEQRVKLLRKMVHKKEGFAFDYETTGLKPHQTGHKIVCASVCSRENKAYAFAFPAKDTESYDLWRTLLSDSTIPKIGHNIKYEHQWTEVLLNTEVQGWEWDTMLATHILDNRRGVCSLKFQTYVNFGVAGYDSDISQYLKGDDKKTANSFNSLRELSANKGFFNSVLGQKLLLYCGKDSLFTFRLAKQQQKRMEGT